MRYCLLNEYQDESPQRLLGEDFDHLDKAVHRAAELSQNGICYGMIHVFDTALNSIVRTDPAGTGQVVDARTCATSTTVSRNDWQRESDRIGVPLIQPRAPQPEPAKPDSNPVVGICGECGLHMHRTMMYCCPRTNCPAGLCGSGATL